jgi:hypothetical protein
MTSDRCIYSCASSGDQANIPFLGNIMSAVQIAFIEFCNSLNFEYFAKPFNSFFLSIKCITFVILKGIRKGVRSGPSISEATYTILGQYYVSWPNRVHELL